MMLFYVDESGTSLNDPKSPYFVLAALVVPASACWTLDARVSTAKRAILSWAEPEDWEIKGREIRRGEKFFKSLSWPSRVVVIQQIANLIVELGLKSVVVQVDKRDVARTDMNDSDLYRVALFRLLDELNVVLDQGDKRGMVMMDSRADHHTAVQDRRIVDAYLRWTTMKETHRLIERPWFGFSAFYPGLQLADFVAYMVDAVSNDGVRGGRVVELDHVTRCLSPKLVQIP